MQSNKRPNGVCLKLMREEEARKARTWNKMERDGRSSIGRAWRGADSTKLKLQISQERNEWYLFFIYLSTWLSSDLNKWSLVVLMFFLERSRFLLYPKCGGLGSRTLVMYKILCINMQFDDSSLMSVGEYRKPQNWPFCKHGTHQYTAKRLAGEMLHSPAKPI